MQNEELIISAAREASVTGAKSSRLAWLARYDEIRSQYPRPDDAAE